jgi:hypothetical protein
MNPSVEPNFCPEAESPPVRIVQCLTGKKYDLMPDNFLVVHDSIQCADGTVYVAGYIERHHPNGVPVDKLTLRRISLKTGEQRRTKRGSK